jgi:pimeloyl-ACP methyl ester carboxylesterase
MRLRVVALVFSLVCWLPLVSYSQEVGSPPEPKTDTPAGASADTLGGFRGFLNRDAVRGALGVIQDIAGQIAFNWGVSQDSRYGLFLDDDWQQRTSGNPLVVIVHGYGSGAEEFGALRGRLRGAGLATAVFSYPNDAAVALSGREFAAALQEFERRYPGRRLALVAHSMGGLLSRMVIEDPDTAVVGTIDKLIMVATPNHGSNLARVPVSFDVWQNWLDDKPDTVKTVLFESVLDGLNEARLDLQPESELLARLNGLPRNPDVSYSLLLGNRGPATGEQLDELRRVILDSQETNAALRAFGPRLEPLLEDLDELVDGLGDGAVAVERGRLEGVDDTSVLDFSHGLITSELTDASSNRLVAEILTRLAN